MHTTKTFSSSEELVGSELRIQEEHTLSNVNPWQACRSRGIKWEISKAHNFIIWDSTCSLREKICWHSFSKPENSCDIVNSRTAVKPRIQGVALTRTRYLPDYFLRLVRHDLTSHPAHGQHGLVAKRRIPEGTLLMPYAGIAQRAVREITSQRFTINLGYEHSGAEIDAEWLGNIARFANDPRGTSLGSNVMACQQFSIAGELFTGIVSTRVINEGEEILLSYGNKFQLDPMPFLAPGGYVLAKKRKRLPLHLSLCLPRMNVRWICPHCGEDSTPLTRNCASCGALYVEGCRLRAEPAAKSLSTNTTSVDRFWRHPNTVEGNFFTSQTSLVREENCSQKENLDTATVRHWMSYLSWIFAKNTVPSKEKTQEKSTYIEDSKPVNGFHSLAATPTSTWTPVPWPIDFPFSFWQLWHPMEPIDKIIALSAPFRPQAAVRVQEILGTDFNKGRVRVLTSEHRVEVDTMVCFCGGVVLKSGDCRIQKCDIPLWFRAECSSYTSWLCMIPNNETQFLVLAETRTLEKESRGTVDLWARCFDSSSEGRTPSIRPSQKKVSNPSSSNRVVKSVCSADAHAVANVKVEFRRDNIGCSYLGLIATRTIHPGEILVLTNEPYR